MHTRFFGQSPQQLVFTTLRSVLNDKRKICHPERSEGSREHKRGRLNDK